MLAFQTLKQDHPELFELVHGTTSGPFLSVAPPEASLNTSISFLSQPSQLPLLTEIKSQLWIVTEALWQKHGGELTAAATPVSAAIATCRNLQVSMAIVLNYFDRRMELLAFPRGISAQSWIHPSAIIEADVCIGPFTTIGPNVKIGAKSVIGAHCTIEGEVEIGRDCYLESHVFVGRQCRIGNECRIKPFASIGSDGFGYAPSPNGVLKIPQLGIVILEDQVDVGSGSCIDRATMTQTRIGRGSKIDNLVHVAHNCDIGKYCFLTAGFAMAGSSKIGDFFMTGGCSAVSDHVVIADKVTLAGASVVTGSIEKPGAYGGNPLQPMQDYLRTRSSLAHVPQIRKQLNRIMKHLGIED
jgi:UDP-3-O-[3-hydroxymyristoyl] glucosamine N-acyltransferase